MPDDQAEETPSNHLTEMKLNRLIYQYKIKCKQCGVWQKHHGGISSNNFRYQQRIHDAECVMCGYRNVIVYELGLTIPDTDNNDKL